MSHAPSDPQSDADRVRLCLLPPPSMPLIALTDPPEAPRKTPDRLPIDASIRGPVNATASADAQGDPHPRPKAGSHFDPGAGPHSAKEESADTGGELRCRCLDR